MPALDGLRILDMTQYEAGTSCTQALAWLGADVVKVERPEGGDPGRGPSGSAEYFVVWNSNKRSAAIDLSRPDGRKLLFDMLPSYDVFVENSAANTAYIGSQQLQFHAPTSQSFDLDRTACGQLVLPLPVGHGLARHA